MRKRFLALLLTFAMLLTLLPAAALADNAETGAADTLTVGQLQDLYTTEGTEDTSEDALDTLYSNFTSGMNEDGSEDRSVYDYDENQVSDDSASLSDDSEDISASTFDLRHVGGTVTYDAAAKKNTITGGTSYVTPVKFQNPWGTCWAFGIVAAAETSILYELDLGTSYEDNDILDLSERHLAWFTKNHIPAKGEEGYGVNDVANQDGEGLWYVSDVASSSMSGGAPYYGTSVFASGTGIVAEYYAPYQGNSGEVKVARKKTADRTVYTQKYLYYASEDAWNAESDSRIKANYFLYCYSDADDWSLDETMRFAQSYALEESNVLPDAAPLKDATTGKYTVLNEDGINAIKSELVSGKAVEAAFFSDSSDPSQDLSTNTARYINANYAHYTWDQTDVNHSVCIVGWDDDYAASNFGQANPVKYDSNNRVVYKLKNSSQVLTYTSSGSSLYYKDSSGTTHSYALTSSDIEPVRETDGSASVPAGNGAWIVKNSWGASDNEFPNQYTWGLDGSGYFYISYYDTSLSMLETYDFAVTSEEQEEYNYSLVEEYDYMPASSTNQSVAYSPVEMVNVFTADEETELEAVSCQTTTPGTKVLYCICLLDAGQSCPDANTAIAAYIGPVQYEYGGYHRETLSQPVIIPAGQKYAILVTEYYTSTNSSGKTVTCYCTCSNTGYNETLAKQYNANMYFNSVINPGESYLLTQSTTSSALVATDYATYIANITKINKNMANYDFDNFSIKAYGRPTNETTVTSVTLNQHSLTLTSGDSATLTANVVVDPDNSISRSVSWTSSNPNVATVNAYGEVQPVATGTTTITATSTLDASKYDSCKVTVTKGFSDVKSTDYFYEPVYWALENKITSGTSDTTFSPNKTCQRCEAVCFLWRLAGSPEPTVKNPFTDVSSSDWYYKAVLWAYQNSIVNGTSDTTFSPTNELTRADFVTILYRYAGSPKITNRSSSFTDVPSNVYYTDAVLWATQKKITSGSDSTHFAPNDFCTRAHTVTFLYRYANLK